METVNEDNWEVIDKRWDAQLSKSIDFMIDNRSEDLEQYTLWIYNRWSEILDNLDEEDVFFVMKVAATLAAEVNSAQKHADKFSSSAGLLSFKKKRSADVFNALAQGVRQAARENRSKLMLTP